MLTFIEKKTENVRKQFKINQNILKILSSIENNEIVLVENYKLKEYVDKIVV